MTEASGRSRVAVLMAVMDRDPVRFLSRALDSLLAQTYREIDIHVMLDRTPGAAEQETLIRAYAARDDRIVVHEHRGRRFLSDNLNALLRPILDRYEYFARMDPDDESLPDRIETQIRYLEHHPSVDICGGWIVDIDERGRELHRVRYPEHHEQLLQLFRRRNPIAHVTVLFRRSYFAKAGLYPPVRLEDGLYWMMGFRTGCRFANVPSFLVRVRRTDDFLRRRSGLKQNWGEFLVRAAINRGLGFGAASYLFGLAMFGAQVMPVRVKRYLYNRLR